MTSISRKLNRAAARRIGATQAEARPPYFDVQPTYYRALHPTRGFRRVSNKRIAAGHFIAALRMGHSVLLGNPAILSLN